MHFECMYNLVLMISETFFLFELCTLHNVQDHFLSRLLLRFFDDTHFSRNIEIGSCKIKNKMKTTARACVTVGVIVGMSHSHLYSCGLDCGLDYLVSQLLNVLITSSFKISLFSVYVRK